jgi:hypothetical protein
MMRSITAIRILPFAQLQDTRGVWLSVGEQKRHQEYCLGYTGVPDRITIFAARADRVFTVMLLHKFGRSISVLFVLADGCNSRLEVEGPPLGGVEIDRLKYV